MPPDRRHRSSDTEKKSRSQINGNGKRGQFGLSRELDMGGLRHHGNQDWPPCSEHDIADRIGHGVAEGRKFALRLFLNGAKCGSDCPSAGTRAPEQ